MNWRFLLIFATLASLLAACAEETQTKAQDSQAEIQKEMKASGDDKNAY